MKNTMRSELMQHVAETDFGKTVEQLTFDEANLAGKKVRKAFDIYNERVKQQIIGELT